MQALSPPAEATRPIIDLEPRRRAISSPRLLPRLAMIAVLLLAFSLRLQRLAIPSLWLDEMGQATPALRGLRAVINAAYRHHGAAPLDYLLTWLALHVAHNDFAARFPAALAATLTVALVYRLGREIYGDLAGALAALLLAVAPLHLRYSQEARFYALFACMAVASSLALVVAVRLGTRRRAWVVYAVLVTAGLYSHYYMPLVVAAQGIAVLATRFFPWRFPLPPPGDRHQALRGFLLSCVAAAIAFLPWLFYAVARERRVPRGTVPELSAAFFQQLGAGLLLGPSQEHVSVEAWLPALYLVLLLAGVVVGLTRPRTRAATLAMAVVTLLGPLVIVLALRFVAYFFELRQVLFLLPFALILVAWGVVSVGTAASWLPRSILWQRRLRPSVTAFLAVLLIGPLWPASQAMIGVDREDWRDALRFVAASAASDEVILTPGLGVDRYLGYYTDEWTEPPQIPTTPEETAAMAGAARAVWVVTIPETAGIAAEMLNNEHLRLDFAPRVAVHYLPTAQLSPAQRVDRMAGWAAPDNGMAVQQLAAALEQAGSSDDAARVLSQTGAGATDPRTAAVALTLLGNLQRRQGDALAALASYRDAVTLWPDYAEGQVRLGEALLLSGDAKGASEALGEAVRLDPDHFWAQRFLGQAYLALGNARQAARQFEAALAIDLAAVDTYVLLGDARAGYRDWKGAAEAYRHFLELAPDSPLASQVQARLDQLDR